MSNVIRADFGAQARAETPRAAGHAVALLHDPDAQEGPVFKVVVGLLSGNVVETVAILPATPEGAADADVTGMAILRSLEVVEESARPPSGA